MSSEDDFADDAPLEPKKQSLWRSSALMASGTLVSRALGLVRNAMLIAVIGVTAGVAVAFPLANTLPNMVYNLLAGGVLDAVLVPQIVKALRTRSGSPYVNKLITAVGSLLFLLTVVAMIGAPLLITLMASTLDPATRSLTITFTLLCLPQIFFYGIYNLFGQILNARGVFGPYMWVPVVNNLISIASLGTFIAIWGVADDIVPVSTFTTAKTLLLCGSATLGVALQAVLLLIPIRRSGVKLRLDFRFKGTSFGSAPKVAMWTFATLVVGQIGVISATNLATRADTWALANDELAAGYNAYQTAYMMYMLPQSLITVTLVTAIFTRLANHAAERNMEAVAANYYRGVQLVLMLTLLASAFLMVTATPLMQLMMPTKGTEAASLYGAVLVALALGVPSGGMIMMSQRVFYALENARPVFLMGIPPIVIEVIIGWSLYFVTSAHWWTIGASAAEALGRIFQGFLACYMVARVVPQVKFWRLIKMYGTYFAAFAGAGLAGWLVMHMVGVGAPDTASGLGRMWGAGWRIVLAALVIAAVYFAILRVIDPAGFEGVLGQVMRRIPALSTFVPSKETTPESSEDFESPELSADSLSDDASEVAADNDFEPGDNLGVDAAAAELHSAPPPPPPPPSSTPPDGIATVTEGMHKDNWSETPPTWDEIFEGESAAIALGRAGATHDPSSTTGALPVLTDAMMSMAVSGAPEEDQLAEWIENTLGVSEEEEEETAVESTPDSSDGAGRLGEARVAPESVNTRAYTPPVAPPPQTVSRRTMGQHTNYVPSPPPRMPEDILAEVGQTDRKGQRRGRFDPTIPTLLIGLAIVIGAIWFAFTNLTPEPDEDGGALAQSQQSELQSGQSGAAPVFSPADLSGNPPTIASASVLSWADDGHDHTDQVGAVTDGDPETFWPSRYFDPANYVTNEPTVLVLNLQEPAIVSKVNVSIIGSGGEVTVINTSGEDQRRGKVLATSPLSWDTVITLDEPTAVTSIGLVFDRLPIDDEARSRVKVVSVSVE